mmetsp:Transcript_36365/g.102732  ORF Transcript_36365/g.102732 Transcript_36365/m.102732 type:complete len:217 (+) Transcript_36365:231-881(+)
MCAGLVCETELLRRGPQAGVELSFLLESWPPEGEKTCRRLRLLEFSFEPGAVSVQPDSCGKVSVVPVTDELSLHRLVEVGALAMLLPLHKLPLVHVTVAVCVESMPMHLVFHPVALIDSAVWELHDPLAVFLVVHIVAFIEAAPLECVLPLALTHTSNQWPLVEISNNQLLVVLFFLLLHLLSSFHLRVGKLPQAIREPVLVELSVPLRLRCHCGC